MKNQSTLQHAAIYVRVSTGHQVDKCSLPFQKKELKAYLQHVLHISNYEIYEDAGKSAKNTNRPAFERMMNDIRAGKVSHVVVYKIDRISRNLVDFSIMHDEFKKYGTTFISLNEQFDTSTAMGEAMLKIILVFAELERKMTSERVSDIMKDRATQGKWNGANVPLGYKWSEEKQFPVPDETEAERVRMIFSMYDSGMRTPAIMHYLNDNHIPTKRNGRWTTKTLADTLRNPFYKGTLRYNYRESAHGKIKPESEWIIIDNNHEPLVDPEMWERVNKIMNANAESKGNLGMVHTPRYIHVFGKLIRCSACDCMMHNMRDKIRRNGFHPSIYGCPNRKDGYMCTEPYSSDATLGPFLFNYIRNMILVTNNAKQYKNKQDLERVLLQGEPFKDIMGLSDASLDAVWELLHANHTTVYYSSAKTPTGQNTASTEVKDLKDKAERLERALERLKKAFLFDDGGMTEKEYFDTKQSLELELVAAKNSLEAAARQNDTHDIDLSFLSKASSFLISQSLQGTEEINYQDLWFAVGREALCDVAHSIIEKVYMHEGRVVRIIFKNGMEHRFIWKEKGTP